MIAPPTISLNRPTPLAQLSQPPSTPIIAQQFDQDVLANLGTMVNNFIESGQIWALIIGFVLGYAFRSMTTYR